MKRIIHAACSLFILATMLISCSSAKGEAMNDELPQTLLMTSTMETDEPVLEEDTKKIQDVVLEALPVPVSQVAWELYSNTYLNNDISQLNMQSIEGDGIFVKIKNNRTDDYSYYVWGCSDENRTHDWQWELDLNNYTGDIPSNGSLVHYSGTFVQSELANDYYWLTNVFLNVKREFVMNSTYDYDCRTLSPTLAYYQLCHALGYISKTEGQTVCLYGRVESLNMDGIHASIQHPYINDLWNIQIDTQENVPKVGSTIIVAGRISSDLMLHNCTVKLSTYQFNASQNEDKNMIIDNTTIPLPPTPVFSDDEDITTIIFEQPYEATIKFYSTDIPVDTSVDELIEKLTEGWENEDIEKEIDLYKKNLKYSNIVVRRKTDAYYEIKAYQDVGSNCYVCIEMTHTQTPYTLQEIYGSAELLVINRIAVMKTIGTTRN